MNNIYISLFLSLLILSCGNPSNDNWTLADVVEIGTMKDTVHHFCSIVPTEKQYSYRVGVWKFMTTDSVIIAEGKYDSYTNMIWDRGGCPYDYKENKINLNNWKFWNLSGDSIEPTRKLLKLIEFKVKNEEDNK